MNKQQVIDKLELSWQALHAAYAGQPAEKLTEPGVTDRWSVKDLLAHVSAWEGEALKYLPLILEGRRPPRYSLLYGGIDAFNAQAVEASRLLSLDEVLHLLNETHRQLLAYLHTIPEVHFLTETRFRHRLRLDTYSHYPIHTIAIREWRQRQV